MTWTKPFSVCGACGTKSAYAIHRKDTVSVRCRKCKARKTVLGPCDVERVAAELVAPPLHREQTKGDTP
jgi:hypothetical protein